MLAPDRFPRAAVLAALVAAATSAASCKHGASGVDGGPPPELAAAVRADSERAKDELWQRAGGGDPVDLARLADREGAAGLLEGLDEGGAVGQTALHALAYADDAELAYQRLGEIVRQVDARAAEPFVDALLDLADRPRAQTERLDPPGVKYAADALVELAQRGSVPVPVRARAISALRLLAEQNAVAQAAIPTNLDPK